ncbi:MAG: hypothetical protein HRU26_15965 [Psychroserpens sp.]|nr:hypothetical protein [Psychroserpens sp.]
MKLQITSPQDSFNLLEVIKFNYNATPGQTSKKSLYVKTVKYKENGDDTFSYSDEAPEEIFIADVDQFIANEVALGVMTSHDKLNGDINFIAYLYEKIIGEAIEVI